MRINLLLLLCMTLHRNWGRGLKFHKLRSWSPPVVLLLTVPRRSFRCSLSYVCRFCAVGARTLLMVFVPSTRLLLLSLMTWDGCCFLWWLGMAVVFECGFSWVTFSYYFSCMVNWDQQIFNDQEVWATYSNLATESSLCNEAVEFELKFIEG